MVLFTLCGCGGMMKYWNIELDILHGQQAFISAKPAPYNEASIGSPVVQKRQEEENLTPTWWFLFMASSWHICCLFGNSCPQIFNLAFFFFFVSKFSFTIYFFLPRFTQRLRSSRHNVILTSLDISFYHPQTTTRRPAYHFIAHLWMRRPTPVHPLLSPCPAWSEYDNGRCEFICWRSICSQGCIIRSDYKAGSSGVCRQEDEAFA